MVNPLPSTDERKREGSPHSIRYVVLRLLAALAIAGAFFAIDRFLLEDDPVREQFGTTVRSFAVESDLLERTLPAKVVVPPKAPPRNRSLLVFLHGRGEDERSYLVEPMFEALAEQRGRAPVVAFPFGGDSSYWHDRGSGEWADYVLAEVIPQVVDRYDVDPDRIAIGGISMGGYGAYNVARIDPSRFCAVGGHSPAVWETAAETADGAFDDGDDFDRNNVIAIARDDPSPYADLRLWLDAGEDDPFLAGDEALEEALRSAGGRPGPVVKRSPGGHDNGYWNANWDDYFRFYAHALGECAADGLTEDLAGKPDEAPDSGGGGAAGDEVPDPEGRPSGIGSSSRSRPEGSSAGGSAARRR